MRMPHRERRSWANGSENWTSEWASKSDIIIGGKSPEDPIFRTCFSLYWTTEGLPFFPLSFANRTAVTTFPWLRTMSAGSLSEAAEKSKPVNQSKSECLL
jgi:hypothetical protein